MDLAAVIGALGAKIDEMRGVDRDEELKQRMIARIDADMQAHGWGPHWLQYGGGRILLKRNDFGNWCGYVEITSEMCPTGVSRSDLIEAIEDTYSASCFDPGVEITWAKEQTLPHPGDVARESLAHLSVVGFDTSHCDDVSVNMHPTDNPEDVNSCKYTGRPHWMEGATYKDYDWVKERAEHLYNAIVGWVARKVSGQCPGLVDCTCDRPAHEALAAAVSKSEE